MASWVRASIVAGCMVLGLVPAAAPAQDYPEPAGDDRCADRARRRDRPSLPHPGAAVLGGLGPPGHRRASARRQQPARRRIRHQGAARRLHPDGQPGGDVRGQSVALQAAALRSVQGLHADRGPRDHQPRADPASLGAGRERQGSGRARQEEAGFVQLRHLRRRLDRPSEHGNVPDHVRHQDDRGPLQGRDAGADRRDRRTYPEDVRERRHRGAAVAGEAR